MAEPFLLVEYLEELDEQEEAVNLARSARLLRDNTNPLALSENSFRKHFRLNRQAVHDLLGVLSPHIVVGQRSTKIDAMIYIIYFIFCSITF